MFELISNPWDVLESEFPAMGTPAEQMRFLLNYAVLAPSGHNTQPWLFKIEDDAIELYADRACALPVVDPDDRELTISCGAALLNLRIALRHFGYRDLVQALPEPDNPDLLARIHRGDKIHAGEEEHVLFEAIRRRRTNRQAFEQREVPADILAALQKAAHAEGAWLIILQTEDDRSAVADLIALGDRVQLRDKHFRRELAAWVRPSRSQRSDGIPMYALRFGDLMSYPGPLVERTFALSNGQAARDRQIARGSPVLAVLGTDVDTAYDWLAAGQALERMLLYARSQGIWASFLNQPIEVPDMRLTLQNMLERAGFPQMLLRMGYGPEMPPTPRRSVSEVLSVT